MIHIIEGAVKSGKTALANSLRNAAISAGQGALMIDDYDPQSDPKMQAHPLHLAEKIVSEVALHIMTKDGPIMRPGLTVDDIPWKVDPVIVVVGKHGQKKLAEIEALLPGFKSKFGPVKKIAL